jgi:predicted small lipoprotein YifL
MRIFMVLLATSLALTACGRRGGLQPPPGAAAVEQQPGAATGADTGTAEEKPDTPFIFDALI